MPLNTEQWPPRLTFIVTYAYGAINTVEHLSSFSTDIIGLRTAANFLSVNNEIPTVFLPTEQLRINNFYWKMHQHCIVGIIFLQNYMAL